MPLQDAHDDHRRPAASWFVFAASVKRVAILLFFFCAALVLLMVFLEERFIFFPTPYDGSAAWHPQGVDYQDVEFHAADGTRLHGWYLPHPAPRAVVLHCHGNAGNIAGRINMAKQLHALGLSVLLFDYRGYGRSEGSPNEMGVLQDARAARALLAQLAGVTESDVVLMGRSLGGAVAVDLAAHDGARGLILESTFTNLADAAAVHEGHHEGVAELASHRGVGLAVGRGGVDGDVLAHGQAVAEDAPPLDAALGIAGGVLAV